MSDTASALFTGLTLASIITTGGLVINLAENFGTLANNGDVQQETSNGAAGERIVGTYGNAVTGMSAVSVALSGLYLIFYIFNWYRSRGNKDASLQRVYLTVMLLAVALGAASAGVNLALTSKFATLVSDGDIVTDPNPVVTGENYKLRGTFGMATLAMASASLGVAGLAWLWMMRLWLWSGNMGVSLSTDLGMGLGSSGSRSKRMMDFSTL